MAFRYQHPSYAVYPPPQWPEDVKGSLSEDDDDDTSLEDSSPTDLTDISAGRRHSMVKVEDDYNQGHMWHERPHSQMAQMRHYSQPTIPTINTAAHSYAHYGQPQAWPMSAQSESSTPTPLYGPVRDPIPVQYTSTSANYSYQQQEPPSAVSMSPQSSQGGWASTTSSDSAEQRANLRSPYPRPMSPMTVVRSDGIRKKNARFEIPKERNLSNIDTLIMQTSNEQEKKELKQQKRLLRNRQAALDSRQRKKTHTEKLEQEKKIFSTQKQELEEMITNLENQIAHERDQYMTERQQYENFIQNIQYERDEALRTKTLETGELRRQNNVLKDCVRELERQQATRSFAQNDATDTFNTDFSNFDLEDNWDDSFSLITGEDLKMEGEDTPQRQLTPRPPPPPTSDARTLKPETLFSNTVWMCMLLGALITSTSTTKSSSDTFPSAAAAALSDDYRAEAGDVLKDLLANQDATAADILPFAAQSHVQSQQPVGLPTTISGHELSRMTNQRSQSSSTLDNLATSLTTPSRHQQAAAAFSLSAESFNHITNPHGILDSPSPSSSSSATIRQAHYSSLGVNGVDVGIESGERQPSRLEVMFREMQASRDDVDRMSGMSGKARERSVLLNRVPEKVLKDFRDMVGRVRDGEKRSGVVVVDDD